MKLLEALKAVTAGHSVISPEGRSLSPSELCPQWLGEHCAIYNNVGLTKAELKGEWSVK